MNTVLKLMDRAGLGLINLLVLAGLPLVAVGLNIVIGYAGLLDLGYVGFYATGAYVVGVLTSQHSDQEMDDELLIVMTPHLLRDPSHEDPPPIWLTR